MAPSSLALSGQISDTFTMTFALPHQPNNKPETLSVSGGLSTNRKSGRNFLMDHADNKQDKENDTMLKILGIEFFEFEAYMVNLCMSNPFNLSLRLNRPR